MNTMAIILLIFLVLVAGFCIVALAKISGAHREQFKRADYTATSRDNSLTYSDFSACYPRQTLSIPSGPSKLTGFLYGADNQKGLIIISSGHRNSTETYLSDMKYFVDHGWMVLCYDYTGYYNSEGKSMLDYTQAVRDLDAVLTYLEATERFAQIPHLLYGHSLGAYVSAAVLRFGHRLSAVVAASGFDKPIEQWSYSVKRFTGPLGPVFAALAALYMYVAFGKDTIDFSAVDGINSTNIPVLVFSGTVDVFYGGKSPIYLKKDKITNPNCRTILKEKEGHNGHFDYILTDRALAYQKFCREKKVACVDKWLIMEPDEAYFDTVNAFFESAIE